MHANVRLVLGSCWTARFFCFAGQHTCLITQLQRKPRRYLSFVECPVKAGRGRGDRAGQVAVGVATVQCCVYSWLDGAV